ncbi:hypothetical protein FGRMN_876 [Fusarium graminum]|nr:hypothetical protein FGRMN_876 [Fusarium graminum]
MAGSSPDDISAPAELKTDQKRAGAERSNARQRASLACVPCRSSDTQTSQPRVPTARIHRHPVSLYYANFHVAHSWLPPRRTLETCSNAKPDDLRFLMTVVSYIGSLYSESGGNPTLRQQAYSMFNKNLPLTIWSVQAVLSLSIAAFGQLDDHVPIFERACQLALSLQLQHKRSADGYKDPVLAESCRRTYWGLYIHRSLLAIPANQLHPLLFPVVTNPGTELPCEEWEYETDIDSWRLRLKNWKKDRVDDDGMVDTILYHALGVSFGLQIQIQRHLQHAHSQIGHRQIDCRMQSGFYTPAPLTQPDHDMVIETNTSLPLTVQTPLRLVSLFNSRLVPERLSPACIIELEWAAIPLVDSLCDNQGQQNYRDKTNFLAANLRKSGEFWPRSSEVLEKMHQRRQELEKLKTLQHFTTVTEALSSTMSLVDSYSWSMPSAMGLVGGWPNPTAQPMWNGQTQREIVSWSETVPQTFYMDVTGGCMAAGMRSPYSYLETKADSVEDGSGASSPHIKTEVRWN